MFLPVGRKILQSALKGIPYDLKGVRHVESASFSLSNPYILEGCDEVILKNSGKIRKYLEGKPLDDTVNIFDELSKKTNTLADVFKKLNTSLNEKELVSYLENSKLSNLYSVYVKTGEKGLYSVFLTKALKKDKNILETLKKENIALSGWKNSLSGSFSHQTDSGFSQNEIKNLYQKAFNGVKVPSGVNYDAFVYLNNLKPEIASKFDAHGLAKIGVADQLVQLNNLLSKGIDKKRPFYTAPLAVAKDAAGIGSGLGTAGGHAYRDGSFIIVSAKNKSLRDDGIKYVIVNDAYYNIIDDLAKKFPAQKFIRADEAVDFFNAM